jgi:hypothetical protein
MSNSTQTIIAQLLYLDAPPLNFARLVADLDDALDRLPGDGAILTWDCEDVAIFECGTLRILLAITDAPGTDYAACLTITAGPSRADAVQSPLLRRADGLCRMIEHNLSARTHPDATLWHRTPRVATADLIDTMVWSLADADLIAWAAPSLPEPPTTTPPAVAAAAPSLGLSLLRIALRHKPTPVYAARTLAVTGSMMTFANTALAQQLFAMI